MIQLRVYISFLSLETSLSRLSQCKHLRTSIPQLIPQHSTIRMYITRTTYKSFRFKFWIILIYPLYIFTAILTVKQYVITVLCFSNNVDTLIILALLHDIIIDFSYINIAYDLSIHSRITIYPNSSNV